MQTRSQTKFTGVKVPEVHGINKGLNPHVKPEQHKSVIMPPTQQTQHIDKRLSADIKLPISIPKPRIKQERTGLRRKPRVIASKPMPRQISVPVSTPTLRAVKLLPETVVQSEETSQSQHHVPAPQPIVQPTPTPITQPIGPRIEHRPIPPYPDPFQRPPARPPDVTDSKDARID